MFIYSVHVIKHWWAGINKTKLRFWRVPRLVGDMKREQEIKLLWTAKAKRGMYKRMFQMNSEEEIVPGKAERLAEEIYKSSHSPWRISGNGRSACGFWRWELNVRLKSGNIGGDREGTWSLLTAFRALSVGPVFLKHSWLMADSNSWICSELLGVQRLREPVVWDKTKLACFWKVMEKAVRRS